MGFARIRGNLTSRIGCRVRFGSPKDVQAAGGTTVFEGEVIDEEWAHPELNQSAARPSENPEDWGDYAFCSQLIRWSDGSRSVRLAYYRRRAGEDYWEYASQMTVNADPGTVKTLLERTLAKTSWF